MVERSDIVISKPGGKVVKMDLSKIDESIPHFDVIALGRRLCDKSERTLFGRFVDLMEEAGNLYRNLAPVRVAELLRDATEEDDDTMESLLRTIIEKQPRLAAHPAIAEAVSQSGRPPETPEQAERKHWLKFRDLSHAEEAANATRDTIAGWVGRRKGKKKQPDRAFQKDNGRAIYLNPTEVHYPQKALNYTPPTK
jgi:hypothetical protein